MAPACLAATLVSSNRRRGRPEARSRLRWPGSTVGWKAVAPVPSPAAACQRRSTSKRSQASRSESPSKACRTMAVASTRAGTVGRPRADAGVPGKLRGEVPIAQALFPRSSPPNHEGTFQCTWLSSDLRRVGFTEDTEYHFGALHFAYLLVFFVRSLVPLRPVDGLPVLPGRS